MSNLNEFQTHSGDLSEHDLGQKRHKMKIETKRLKPHIQLWVI